MLDSRRSASWHFWLMFIGFNLTFAPDAHPRAQRHAPSAPIGTPRASGWDLWNLMSTIGAFLIAVSVPRLHLERHLELPEGRGRRQRSVGRSDPRMVDFLAAAGTQLRPGPDRASPGRLLASEVRRGRGGPCREADAGARPANRRAWWRNAERIHMPSPSYYPIVSAVGIAVLAIGSGVHLVWPSASLVTRRRRIDRVVGLCSAGRSSRSRGSRTDG